MTGYLTTAVPDCSGSAHAPEPIRTNLAETRERGYTVNPGLILEGSWGMGAAVIDQQGRRAWALSLTGIEQRFRPDRQEFLGKLLLEETHKLTQKLREQPHAGR